MLDQSRCTKLDQKIKIFKQIISTWQEALANDTASETEDIDPIFKKLVDDFLGFPKGKAVLADAITALDKLRQDQKVWKTFEEQVGKFDFKTGWSSATSASMTDSLQGLTSAFDACKHLHGAEAEVFEVTRPLCVGMAAAFKDVCLYISIYVCVCANHDSRSPSCFHHLLSVIIINYHHMRGANELDHEAGSFESRC